MACEFSAEKPKIAAQTVCKYLYHHDYLSIEGFEGDNECSMPSAASSTDAFNKLLLTDKRILASKSDHKDYMFCLVQRG